MEALMMRQGLGAIEVEIVLPLGDDWLSRAAFRAKAG
jgi:hypothetical protein